ncbi:MAG: hypothetical protein NVS1B13_08300 [Flavisolibacter sp.]
MLQVLAIMAQKPIHNDRLYQNIVRSGEDTSKALAYLSYGSLFENTQPDSAEYYYTKSKKLSERLSFRRGFAVYVSYEITLLNNKGKYREALELCKQAIPIYKGLGSEKNVAIAYNNLGNEYEYLGEIRQATSNFLSAEQIADQIHENALLRTFSNNVASVFILLKEYDKSLFYAAKSLEVAQFLKDTFGIASSLVNLALCKKATGKYLDAEQELKEVLVLGRILEDYSLELDSYNNLGGLYNQIKEYSKAIEIFETALKIAIKNKNPGYELIALQGLAESFQKKGRLAEADQQAQKAIRIAILINARQELDELYLRAALIREDLGDYKMALFYNKEYQKLNDTLLNEKIRDNINDMEVQYQTATKDKAIAEQSLALEKNKIDIRNKNMWLGILIIGVLLFIALTVLSFRFYRQKQALNQQAIRTLENDKEVIRLKSVLEGKDEERQRISKEMHDDLGSGLTSILYLIDNLKEANPGQADGISHKISLTANALVDKMNEIIWSMNKGNDNLEDLVVYLRHSIGELLENAKIAYSFNIPDEIPAVRLTGEQRRNIYLVVKEATHNIMKHARASYVTIDFFFSNTLRIKIHDNGKGIDMEKLRKFGNGLNNMHQRMSIIGGKLLVQADQGSLVDLTLPLPV